MERYMFSSYNKNIFSDLARFWNTYASLKWTSFSHIIRPLVSASLMLLVFSCFNVTHFDQRIWPLQKREENHKRLKDQIPLLYIWFPPFFNISLFWNFVHPPVKPFWRFMCPLQQRASLSIFQLFLTYLNFYTIPSIL